jgi:hypothetical protein
MRTRTDAAAVWVMLAHGPAALPPPVRAATVRATGTAATPPATAAAARSTLRGALAE